MSCKQAILAAPSWGPRPAAPNGRKWEALMELALQEAEQASLAGEVPVGAVLVQADGLIIGQGHNRNLQAQDPSAHAEMEALRLAAKTLGSNRLRGCVMVVTLEPCLMCAGAIREARLDGVVFGATDARSGAIVSCLPGFDLDLISPKPWHYGGVLAERCAAMLSEFFTSLRQPNPLEEL